MGRMLICHGKKAETPLYMKEFELHIYTIEELCYCLNKNLHMLDNHLMREQLCMFLEKELGLEELATHLRKVIENQEGLARFVRSIMKYTGYLNEDELVFLEAELKDVEGKSSIVRRKAKADFFLENGRFVKAIREYEEILKQEPIEEAVMEGNIYHNMATAYGRLFFFKEAADYYCKAYEKNQDRESYESYLLALHMYLPKEEYIKTVTEEMVSEELALSLEQKLQQAMEQEQDSMARKRVRDIWKQKEAGYIQEYYKGMDKLFEDYKQEYRGSMAEG